MMVMPLIAAVFNIIILALTPVQRWSAARRFNADFLTVLLFILIIVATVTILTVSILITKHRQKIQERDFTERSFAEYSEERGLSKRERRILLAIANYAGLKRSESIFTLSAAFDIGAARIIKENLAHRGAEVNVPLKTELSFLREKLGFKKKPLSSIGLMMSSKKLSSRQIPIGKEVRITRRLAHGSEDIESTVIKNDDMGLTVRLAAPLEGGADELWRAHYYFGASVWEFDVSVISSKDDVLVLEHSDNVRFINRRSFLRVPVKNPAFIARFPFARTVAKEGSFESQQSSANAPSRTWGPPEFVPAVITELGGPGLRIDTSLEINAGDRVLVAFELEEGKGQKPISEQSDSSAAMLKIIQDIGIVEEIGEVKRINDAQDGLSIAVELIGLSDSDVDELIRATNAASLRGNVGNTEEPMAIQGA